MFIYLLAHKNLGSPYSNVERHVFHYALMDRDERCPKILSGEIILSEGGDKAYKVIKKVRNIIVLQVQNILQILCSLI